MYRLLVIDDEAFVTDGLCRMLESVQEYELDVYKAYSAQEALEFLNRTSVDIVITDIRMPGMSGLELQKEIARRWPSCRVVFLTGHDTFEYAYQALQYHAARYLLKSEGDEAIREAVAECIRDIDLDERNDRLLTMADEQMSLYRPVLRRECLRRLLRRPITREEMAREFERLGIGLSPELSVLVLVGRFDRYHAGAEELITPVNLLVTERLGHAAACEMAFAEPDCLVWLLQPVDGGYERAAVTVKGVAESIQRSTMQMLGVPLSLLFDQTPADWDALPARFAEMHHLVQYRMDRQSEMVFADRAFFLGDVETGGTDDLRALRERTSDLAFCLDCGDREAFNALLEEFIGVLGQSDPGFMGMEIMQSLNLIFVSFINRHGLERQVAADPVFADLSTPYFETHDKRLLHGIARMGNRLLDFRQSAQKDRNDAFVEDINRYIQEHLNADLSLVALSEHVYLNPSYLSRRYKELTGKNLSEVIAEARMAKALKLLCNHRYKISEISSEVGYESPSYFSRLFRRRMDMTPQEYRDRLVSR